MTHDTIEERLLEHAERLAGLSKFANELRGEVDELIALLERCQGCEVVRATNGYGEEHLEVKKTNES